MYTLRKLCAGQRVLFVNSIRTDTRSGGDTVTRLVRQALATAAELKSLEFVPASNIAFNPLSRILFFFESFPGSLFVLLYRRLQWTSLEFLSRLSPVFALRCLWMRYVYRPQQVIFNHHATFLYARIFNGVDISFIWHDVPSTKGDTRSTRLRNAFCCAALESWIQAPSCLAFTFSSSEARFLRRYYKLRTIMLPAVSDKKLNSHVFRRADKLLMLGNWSRNENCEGALRFFTRLLICSEQEKSSLLPAFTIAGANATTFLHRMRVQLPAIDSVKIGVIENFHDLSEFDTCALVAPIVRGAGIKIKTLEAWAANLPVIGTRQAYSGLPGSVWKLGGRRFDSINALATFCRQIDVITDEISKLRPAEAFDLYLSLSGDSDSAQ